MWWSDWYASATGAVSGSITAVETSVAPLFKENPNGSGAYVPDDAPLSDVLRDRASGTPADLFPMPADTWPVNTDVQQAIVSRPKTWDEMSFWEKAKTYVGIAPGAIADTIGLSERPGASTPVSGPNAGFQTVGNTISDTAANVGASVGNVVGKTLGLPAGGVGGFLSSTLVKVLIGLVVIVVGLFFVLRITNRVTGA